MQKETKRKTRKAKVEIPIHEALEQAASGFDDALAVINDAVFVLAFAGAWALGQGIYEAKSIVEKLAKDVVQFFQSGGFSPCLLPWSQR